MFAGRDLTMVILLLTKGVSNMGIYNIITFNIFKLLMRTLYNNFDLPSFIFSISPEASS